MTDYDAYPACHTLLNPFKHRSNECAMTSFFLLVGESKKKNSLREGSQNVSRTWLSFRSPFEKKGRHLSSEPEKQSSFAKLRSGTASRWFPTKKKNFKCVRWTLN